MAPARPLQKTKRIGAAILSTGLLVAGPAAAQDPTTPAPAPPPPPASSAPAPPAPPGPAQTSPRAPGPQRPAAAPAPRWRGKRAVPKPKRVQEVLPPYGTPIASFPGFARLDDGKSRIFVEVSRKVHVVEMRTAGRVTYRLQGATVVQRTNQLSLITGFFTTPVARVQLVPMGSDVDVVIELRETVQPTHIVTETPRGMVLWVDFPRASNFGHDRDDTSEPSRPRGKRMISTQTLGDDVPPSTDD